MTTTFVLSGLVKKRSELSGDLEKLRQQMIQVKGEIATIDNAIHLFDPDYNVKTIKAVRKRTANKYFESGERARAIVDVVRESDKPLSVKEIADVLCEQRELDLQDKDYDKFLATLHDGVRQQSTKGIIVEASRANGTPRYQVKGLD